ncbi:MAG TPA: VCBS repeat-containing protein [Gemmataceae bacterium]
MVASWVRRLFQRQAGGHHCNGRERLFPGRFRPLIDSLEDRTLLSFGGVTPALNVAANTSAVAVADFDHDGQTDIVSLTTVIGSTNFLSVNKDGSTTTVPKTSLGGPISVALGNGDNSFRPPTLLNTPADPTSVWVADVNGDGNADVLPTYPLTGTTGLSIFLGNGDGTFQIPITPDLGPGILGVATGDFNGDSKLDIAVACNGADEVAVFTGNGDGSFNPPVVFAAGQSVTGIGVADFNGDHLPDIVVGGFEGINLLQNSTM